MLRSLLQRFARARRGRPSSRRELVSRLLSLSEHLTGELEFDRRMTLLCEAAQALVGCDRSSLFLLDGEAYRARYNAGNPPDIAAVFERHRVRMDDPLIARAVAARAPITLNDAANDALMNAAVASRARIHAIVVAPLFDRDGNSAGFMTAEYNERRLTFDDVDAQLFQGIANLVELAIVTEEARRERADLEDRLQQAERLDSLSRFAGSVAHDFNNRLTAMLGLGELAAAHVEDPKMRADLLDLIASTESAAAMTRKLVDFSKGVVTFETGGNAGHVVSALRDTLRRIVAPDVELAVEVRQPDLFVGCGDSEIERIVTNLVLNASDACGSGDTITVELDRVEIAEGTGATASGTKPGEYVLLSVRDTGSGIPNDDLDRVFEPFFTTKGRTRGTGLGLSSVLGLVTAAGGQIDVESAEGTGTTFRALFPAAPVPTRAAATPPVERGAMFAEGPATVLAVDNDQAIRAVIRRTLEEQGLRVLEAADGVHALAVAKAFSGRIDLVVTDVVMPEVGGQELVEQLRSGRPHLAALFISGYAPDFRLGNAGALADETFLPKPFSASRLRDEVLRILGPERT